jgi:hypothetical protein
MRFSFGKYKGISIEFVNSGYLKWLLGEEWFHDEYEELVVEVAEEYDRRTDNSEHFYKDKVKV